MGSNREQQLVDKIRQLLPDSKKKYTWIDIEKVDFLILNKHLFDHNLDR
jgi:hypothetical protein